MNKNNEIFKTKVFKGIVVPIAWDETGDVSTYGLEMSDGRDMILNCSKCTGRIHDFLNLEIQIKGVAYKNVNGDEILMILHV